MSKKPPTKKRTLAVNITPSDMGKLPPQAIELEEAVLGAMLLEREAVEAIITILTQEAFYKEQNGRIFNAIVNLYRKSQPIDILTVTQELKLTGELEIVGGAYYVSTLTNRIASSANIEFHARIVLQKQLARELIRINIIGISKAYDDQQDIFELFSDQTMEVEGLLGNIQKHEISTVGQIHADFINESYRVLENGISSGVPTGFESIDKFMSGWQKSDLIIVAGRPGMGKTALAICAAYREAVYYNIPVAFFSLEMSKTQLVARINSARSEIDLNEVAKMKIQHKDKIAQMHLDNEILLRSPLYIDDTPGLSLLDLRSKLRRLVAKYGVKIAYIDYLQLMTSGLNIQMREQEIATISRGLKILAKELNIPIIAMAQLSRQVENRPGGTKKPQLSDLRESGAIEQDADMVIFAYRPEYYEITEYAYGNETFPTKNLFSAIIAKHRNGGLGEVFLGFINEYAKLTNWNFETNRPKYEQEWDYEKAKALKEADLANKKNSDTFVQDTKESVKEDNTTKLETNTDFLNQKDGTEPPF